MPASFPSSIWTPTTKNTNDVIQAAHIDDAQNEIVAIENYILTAYTAFTPSWTNLSVGNGSSVGLYRVIGKTAFVVAYVIFGTTTSVTGSVDLASLPAVTPAALSAETLGIVTMFDSSASGFYRGTGIVSGGTSVHILNDTGTLLTATDATHPFTWAVSDQLYVTLQYRTT